MTTKLFDLDGNDTAPVSLYTLGEVILSLKAAARSGRPLDATAVGQVAMTLDAVNDILYRYPPRCPCLASDLSGIDFTADQIPDHMPCPVCGLLGTASDAEYEACCTCIRCQDWEQDGSSEPTAKVIH